MRTYVLISALAGLLLTTLGQTVSEAITTATFTSAESQSSTTETIGATSATSDSQSSTSETNTATSESQSSQTSAPDVTSVTGSSVGETSEPTSAETNKPVTEGGSSPSSTFKPEITTPTAAPTTTVPVNRYCNATSCGNSFATCIQLYTDYICQCPLNYFFNETDLSCTRGDSFYGKLELSDRPFNPLKDSKQYTDIYNEVVNHFRGCFKENQNYSDTVITDIRANLSKVQIRNSKNVKLVEVRCVHVFQPDTVTEKDVKDEINKYEPKPGIYKPSDICDGHYCDLATTYCTLLTNSYPACHCKENFYPSSSHVTFTSCRGCDPKCGDFPGEQCMQSDPTKLPYCGCLPGYQKKYNYCEKCKFGYSGEQCTDNFLLILVITGSVAGAVVIALLGTVIGLSVRSSRRKRDNERTQLIIKDTMESPMAGNLFPKVQAKTDQGYVNRGSSPYDIADEYQRPTPKRDYDDDPWYEMSRRERRY